MIPSPDAAPSFETLFEHAPCGLMVTDRVGNILRVNATFAAWSGYDADALAGHRRFQDLLTMGGKVFHQTHWYPLLQMQGSVAEVKLDIVHRSGHTVPMLINACLRQHGGDIYQEIAFVVVADRHKYERELLQARRNAETALQAQHEAQRALERSQHVLSMAMRGARMAIWSRDLRTGTFWWSPALRELVGLGDEDAATDRDFFDLVHEDDRPALLASLARAEVGRTDYIAEFRLRVGDRQWRWMEGRGRAMPDKDGRISMLYGLVTDIHDRKEAQTVILRHAAIFAHQSDAILILTARGRVVDFNPGGERMVDHDAATVIGQRIDMLLAPGDGARILREAWEAVRARGEWRGEVQFRKRDGSRGVCECVVKPLRSAAGKADGAVAIARDVTERRRAEARLHQLNQQLSEADRRKDEFLATLAHELRNPLAPMRNVLSILDLRELPDPQLRWAREVLGRQLRQLSHLVDDLLEVSRITKGKIELRPERVELADIVHAAVETAKPGIEAARHEIRVAVPSTPVRLNADPVRLTQILLNLLTNAVKYTPPGGRIDVRVRIEQSHAVLSVRDSGIGIPAEALDHVFEMFSQLTPALERSQGGLGIGLALVRGLVELHGGSVRAHSEGAGRGSEFEVRLPLAEGPCLPCEAPASLKRLSGCRVLVVDDNVDAASSLAIVLEMHGNEVCVAHDGNDGIALARGMRPDVALIDIGLPGLSGYEVARALRADPRGQRIFLVALTGWGQQADKLAAHQAGFDRHVTKPVDPGYLLELLAERVAPAD